MIFQDRQGILERSWQSFERDVCRLLMHDGFKNVRLVGSTGDHGADIIATRETQNSSKRWLFQTKLWKKPVGQAVIRETLNAVKDYEADVPVVVSASGFDSSAEEFRRILQSEGVPLQLWGPDELSRLSKNVEDKCTNTSVPRPYQEKAIQEVVNQYVTRYDNRALVVMATGLGKTFVAAESIRRIRVNNKCKVLVCAHANDLVYQLERAFWPFLKPSERTVIMNSYERPTFDDLESADFTFACVDSVSNWINSGKELPNYGILLVDECHHVGCAMYDTVFSYLNAGRPGGPFALGLTATPWRPDEVDLQSYFGYPVVSIDMVMGLRNGFLTNVDYRMYTTNIDWESLKNLEGKSFSPKQINRTLFIDEWDDSVVVMLKNAWKEQSNPRAIVFCGTIDHARVMRDKINSLGFASAEAIYSSSKRDDYDRMTAFRRNRILSDFSDGRVNVVCAVDIFNEGIDVPDVNIIVFQRVTHSRRIFVQQLGRGLRISEGKDKVIVLDFVSDIRRFAAGLELKDEIERASGGVRINLNNKVQFLREGGDDPQAESFLRQWLEDVAAIESADDDAAVLKFPPILEGGL